MTCFWRREKSMSRKFVFCILILGLMIMFVTAVSAQDTAPRPVIIDSDMITDDWMAILLTFKNPDFDVKAITVTGTGFAYCYAGTQIALGIIELAQAGDIPVSCWRDTPLFGANAVAAHVADGMLAADMTSAGLLIEMLATSTEKLTVLALGMLTNVGAALEANPSLVDKIEMINVMGGAVDLPGTFINEDNTMA